MLGANSVHEKLRAGTYGFATRNPPRSPPDPRCAQFEPQLPAHHIAVGAVPHVVTHPAPPASHWGRRLRLIQRSSLVNLFDHALGKEVRSYNSERDDDVKNER